MNKLNKELFFLSKLAGIQVILLLNKLFSQVVYDKRKFSFINNLYLKLTVASVCTVLGFALGANTEAKAATFTLRGTEFVVEDTRSPNGSDPDGLGDAYYNNGVLLPVNRVRNSSENLARETRAFYEFSIGNLSSAANTVISHAIFESRILNLQRIYRYLFVDLYGYVGNGGPDISDFQAGVLLGGDNIFQYPPYSSEPPTDLFKFDQEIGIQAPSFKTALILFEVS